MQQMNVEIDETRSGHKPLKKSNSSTATLHAGVCQHMPLSRAASEFTSVQRKTQQETQPRGVCIAVNVGSLSEYALQCEFLSISHHNLLIQ
jgi:hypothetical protein